jgi:hypothetical protein
VQLVQPLAELAHQLLATGETELAIATKAFPQAFDLIQVLPGQPLRRGPKGTLHEPAEGVGTALQISEAALGFQLGGFLEGVTPSPQACWQRIQVPSDGFSWLS